MKENIRINLNNEIFYVTTEDTMLELENKIYSLQNTIDAIGFLSMVNIIMLMIYIGTNVTKVTN